MIGSGSRSSKFLTILLIVGMLTAPFAGAVAAAEDYSGPADLSGSELIESSNVTISNSTELVYADVTLSDNSTLLADDTDNITVELYDENDTLVDTQTVETDETQNGSVESVEWDVETESLDNGDYHAVVYAADADLATAEIGLVERLAAGGSVDSAGDLLDSIPGGIYGIGALAVVAFLYKREQ